MPRYPDDSLVLDARTEYFSRSGFEFDGGYADRWVRLKARGVTVLIFPNTAARVRSVKLHDLHHVLTEYDTTWAGEAEIGAWELASGCGRHYPAWLLNTGAVMIGLLVWPKRVYAAFQRGRRSGNLYTAQFTDDLLHTTVGELRRRIRLASDPGE
jgi:hypothetical protein